MSLQYYTTGEPMWTCGVCKKHLDFDIEKSFHYCLEHQQEGAIRDQVEREKWYKRDIENYNGIETNIIVCPYCFSEHVEMSDYPRCLRHDGDDARVTCWDCDKEFRVCLSVEYTFTSSKL